MNIQPSTPSWRRFDSATLRILYQAARKVANIYGHIGILDPDDIAQIALLKFLDRTDLRRPSTGWLARVVQRVAYDAMRKHTRESRHRVLSLDDAGHFFCERADEEGIVQRHRYCPPATADDNDDDDDPYMTLQLQNMLRQLPAPMRSTLALYSAGYTYEQIAQATGSHIGTVRSRLHHARARARTMIDLTA
jgi:RNA polymerase sigma factor (sigma-70 family)